MSINLPRILTVVFLTFVACANLSVLDIPAALAQSSSCGEETNPCASMGGCNCCCCDGVWNVDCPSSDVDGP